MPVRRLTILGIVIAAAAFVIGMATAPRGTQHASTTPQAASAPSPTEPARRSMPGSLSAAGNVNAPQSKPSPATVEAVFDALGERTHGGRGFAVSEAMAGLDVDQIEAVLAQVESVGRFDQAHILPRAIDRLMELAPDRALAWIETNAPTFREGSTTFIAAFAMVAQRDLKAAQQLFERIPAGSRRDAMARTLLFHLAEHSPAEAKALLETFPKGAARDLPVQGYVNGLGRADPDAAITQALTWGDGAAQRTALAMAFNMLGKASATRAISALDRITKPRLRGDIFEHLVARANAQDLPALAQYYERMSREAPDFAEQVNNISRLAEGFAIEDPVAALAWSEKLPAEDRKKAHDRVLYVWGYREPEKALAWATENGPDEAEKQRRMSIALGSWLDLDFSAARDWIEKMPEGATREKATQRVVWRYAARGEDDAAEQWLAHVPDADRGKLAGDIAADLAWKNPSHAARWLAHLEPDENSAPLFGRVAAQWAESDVQAAGAWVNALPAGTVRDAAIGQFAREVATLDPGTAAEWAASASSEDARNALVPMMLHAWHERDPSAATRWLESTAAISAERKERMLRYFR